MAIPVQGIAHLRLTVTDITRSREFYETIFGFPIAIEVPADADEATRERLSFVFGGVIYAIPGGVLGLRPVAPGSDRFDEDRVGLDHLSFAVPSKTALEEAAALLAERGIPTPGIKQIPSAWILEFRDPDGIALELTAPLTDTTPAAAPV
jgi:glyoxylase I family protein